MLWTLMILTAIPFALFLIFLSLTIYSPDHPFFKQFNNSVSMQMMIIAILTCGGSCLLLICYRFWVSRHWKSSKGGGGSSSAIDLGGPFSKLGGGSRLGGGLPGLGGAGPGAGPGAAGLPKLNMPSALIGDPKKDKDDDPLGFLSAMKPKSMV